MTPALLLALCSILDQTGLYVAATYTVDTTPPGVTEWVECEAWEIHNQPMSECPQTGSCTRIAHTDLLCDADFEHAVAECPPPGAAIMFHVRACNSLGGCSDWVGGDGRAMILSAPTHPRPLFQRRPASP